jgi:uncharacterized phage protein gp47/JayE
VTTFVPRSYAQIVRDLLTTLTGGVTGESLTVPPGEGPIPLLTLRDRPVQRVSHLEGQTLVGRGDKAKQIPYRFTAADFELVASSPGSDEPDAIRFRDDGRRPVPGTALSVNYYPLRTDPVPLTDLNVGSVTRTLMETVARELAVMHMQLQHVYDSAFVETAEGSALDKVVALVGVGRLPAGHPVARLRFSRRAGTPGRITVPANTAVTDAAGSRYLTLETITLESGESSLEVLARGESPGTKPVEAGELNRPEVLIAGIAEVTNPQPARLLDAAETDEQLRVRARGALHGVVRGTLDALRFGLRSIPSVTDVTIVEQPNGVAGEIRVDVAYADESPEPRAAVAEAIQQLRPAGILVAPAEAERRRVAVRVELTLAGTGLAGAELARLTASIEDELARQLGALPPGGVARRSRLTASVLAHAEVLDARVVLAPGGLPETEDLDLTPSPGERGAVLDVQRPFTFVTTVEVVDGAALSASVSALLPVHLVAGVTIADAKRAIESAVDAHLQSRAPGAPLTFDSLAAAIRDDTRFALVRADGQVTIEAGGRFLQLTDGLGSYAPAANETMRRDRVDLDERSGAVLPA